MQAKTKRMLLGLAVLLALAGLALALYYNVPRKIALEVPAVVLTDWPDQEDVELLEQTTLRISGTWSPGIRDRDITLESVVVDGLDCTLPESAAMDEVNLAPQFGDGWMGGTFYFVSEGAEPDGVTFVWADNGLDDICLMMQWYGDALETGDAGLWERIDCTAGEAALIVLASASDLDGAQAVYSRLTKEGKQFVPFP